MVPTPEQRAANGRSGHMIVQREGRGRRKEASQALERPLAKKKAAAVARAWSEENGDMVMKKIVPFQEVISLPDFILREGS